MTDLKPVECPLLPGVEPIVAVRLGRKPGWQVFSSSWAGGYIEGPRRPTEAEAITAWNEWMARIEPAVVPIAVEDGAPIAPIAKLTVDAAGTVTSASLYAPGLPDGTHDVYPVAVVKP